MTSSASQDAALHANLNLSLPMFRKLCGELDLATGEGLRFRAVWVLGASGKPWALSLVDFAHAHERQPEVVDALLRAQVGRPVQVRVGTEDCVVVQVFDDARVRDAGTMGRWVVCPCGNHADHFGFVRCDVQGLGCAEDDLPEGVEGTCSRCEVCRRIFDNGTLEVVGHAREDE